MSDLGRSDFGSGLEFEEYRPLVPLKSWNISDGCMWFVREGGGRDWEREGRGRGVVLDKRTNLLCATAGYSHLSLFIPLSLLACSSSSSSEHRLFYIKTNLLLIHKNFATIKSLTHFFPQQQ